jgi:Na+/H+ antiporter NhaD/arsenite permease-like protein
VASSKLVIGVAVFAITYVLISIRRLGSLPLGRPGAALVGAVAAVAFGVVPVREALSAIDGNTILLLFGMMGMGAFVELDGVPERLLAVISRRVRTRHGLLALVIWGAGIAGALVTNDAICVLGAPFVVALVRRYDLPAAPYVIGLATAANTGSVATLVGNPQNMLCASLGHLGYRQHLVIMLPVAILGLALNHALIAWFHRKELVGDLTADGGRESVVNRATAVTLATIAGTTALYLVGFDLAWTAVGGLTLLLLAHRRDANDVWPRIEWPVLIFFSSLFIVVRGLVDSGAAGWLFARFPLWPEHASWARLSSIFLVGSNVVSNVPFILVVEAPMRDLPNPVRGWELLAMASTFAGNLTLLGSVANIIVAERAREVGGLGFWTHLRVGLPLAAITTAFGTAWVCFFT